MLIHGPSNNSRTRFGALFGFPLSLEAKRSAVQVLQTVLSKTTARSHHTSTHSKKGRLQYWGQDLCMPNEGLEKRGIEHLR